MGNFYQFLPIASCPLLGKFLINNNHNSKTLWLSFFSVITLTQQMRQQSNPVIAQLLRRMRKGVLTQVDILMLSEKVVTDLIPSNPLNNIVIVQ